MIGSIQDCGMERAWPGSRDRTCSGQKYALMPDWACTSTPVPLYRQLSLRRLRGTMQALGSAGCREQGYYKCLHRARLVAYN